MSAAKQCQKCMEVYPANHWAAGRQRCPACGGALIERPTTIDDAFEYEHYDSSADIQFDLTDLLGPDQRRESKLVLGAGLGLLLLAFGARLGFVILGRLEGFWTVPVWFDVIVIVMLLVAVVMIAWSARRLARHRRAIRRGRG